MAGMRRRAGVQLSVKRVREETYGENLFGRGIATRRCGGAIFQRGRSLKGR